MWYNPCLFSSLKFVSDLNIVKEAKIEIRESLLTGSSSKFAKVKRSWEIMSDGTRRFVSAEFYGGGD